MIVILCNSFQDAKDAFDIFMQFLEDYEPFSIQKELKSSYAVETDEDLRYIFVDYRMEHLFDKMTPDILWVDEFFEGLYPYSYY